VREGTYAGNTNFLGDITGGNLIVGAYSATIDSIISGYFHGKVDDVAIYNRALSEAEITQLYNQTVSKY
jgi:hypothetical protein